MTCRQTVLTSVNLDEQPLKPAKAPSADRQEDSQKAPSKKGCTFGFQNGGAYAYGHRLHIPQCIYLGLNHALALYAVYLLVVGSTVKRQTLAFAFFLWPFSGLGITA